MAVANKLVVFHYYWTSKDKRKHDGSVDKSSDRSVLQMKSTFLMLKTRPIRLVIVGLTQGRILKSKFVMVHLKPFKCFVWLQDIGVGTVSKVGVLTEVMGACHLCVRTLEIFNYNNVFENKCVWMPTC